MMELVAAYWKHAQEYYRKDGEVTTQVDNIRQGPEASKEPLLVDSRP